MNDRQLAFLVLNRIERDKAYSNLTLDSYISRYGKEISNASFITALVYGVTERKITLDYILSLFLSQPIKRLKPEVLTVLRMGTYQLKFMSKIPPSAAVNESVRLAKRNGCTYASGLVNSVLRKIAANEIIYPKTDNIYYDLSVRYSCPEPLVKRFCLDYGVEDATGILSVSLGGKSVKARVNTLKTDTNTLLGLLKEENVEARALPELQNHIEIIGTSSVEKLDCFKNGLFHIQDLSSAMCVEALSPFEGMTVIDFCSAPGGKAFTAAERMKNKGVIYAFDLYSQRVKLIKDGAKRLGIDIIKAETGDSSLRNASLDLIADRVLCDVPCSGLGVIGRKPEIRYKDLDSIDKLCDLQYNILVNSSHSLKKDGLLVYSTCSINKKENEGVCDRFLESNPEFIKQGDYKTLLPHKINSDGFFTASFRRK